jgi:hypothetical protein
MKFLVSILLLTLYLGAEFIDRDLDGVEDSIDKCPNSDFFVIVDKNGCSVKKLLNKSDASYSVSLGYIYSKDETIKKSYIFNLSFNYKNFSGYIESSRYSMDNISGIDDTTIALYYNFNKKDNIIYTVGGGVYLPTNSEDGNRADYYISMSAKYFKGDFSSYITYTHTFMRDSDSVDTNSYSLALGWRINNDLYSLISYTLSNSIYSSSSKTEYLNLYTSYYLNKNLYISFEATKGLNSNSIDKNFSFLVGYDF